MKKIFLFIVLITLFVSLFGCTADVNNPRVNEVIYRGHSYIVFRVNGNYGQTYVHDPDCSCRK